MPIDYNLWIIIPVVLFGIAIVAIGLYLWFAIGAGRVWGARGRMNTKNDDGKK